MRFHIHTCLSGFQGEFYLLGISHYVITRFKCIKLHASCAEEWVVKLSLNPCVTRHQHGMIPLTRITVLHVDYENGLYPCRTSALNHG